MGLPHFTNVTNPIFRSSFNLTFVSLSDEYNHIYNFIDYSTFTISDKSITIDIRQNISFLENLSYGDGNKLKYIKFIILEVFDKLGNVVSKKILHVNYISSITNFDYNVVDILITNVTFDYTIESDIDDKFCLKEFIRNYKLNELGI
jgi:hypothetical protein